MDEGLFHALLSTVPGYKKGEMTVHLHLGNKSYKIMNMFPSPDPDIFCALEDGGKNFHFFAKEQMALTVSEK
jgi:hypothetical protein